MMAASAGCIRRSRTSRSGPRGSTKPWKCGNPETPLGPDHIAAIKAWIAERREANTPFEIVIEGTTPGDNLEATLDRLQPLADAGATWWIESMWGDSTVDDLKRRIEQDPPDV